MTDEKKEKAMGHAVEQADAYNKVMDELDKIKEMKTDKVFFSNYIDPMKI